MTTIVFNTFEVEPQRGRSYVRGMIETFNLRGNNSRSYHFHSTGEQADMAAIQNDWETVGQDLTNAFESVATK